MEKILLAIRVHDSVEGIFESFKSLGAKLSQEDTEGVMQMLLGPFSNKQLGGAVIDLAWMGICWGKFGRMGLWKRKKDWF